MIYINLSGFQICFDLLESMVFLLSFIFCFLRFLSIFKHFIIETKHQYFVYHFIEAKYVLICFKI